MEDLAMEELQQGAADVGVEQDQEVLASQHHVLDVEEDQVASELEEDAVEESVVVAREASGQDAAEQKLE